jgi:8-oxo-dGTP pyrophosphatase MutT (NUDIX family)
MSGGPRIRHSVRVLLLDEADRVLLFRGEEPSDGRAFWFPTGGGIEEGEDVHQAAAREVAEETGLSQVTLGPEIWHRRHIFTWRGVEWDQRERWFLARVRNFTPSRSGLTEAEHDDLTASRWWSVDELENTRDELVPRDLAKRLRSLLTSGPPPAPIEVGI